MASSYVYKWKLVQNEKGAMERTVRLRQVLRGPMDFEAFDVETFFGDSTAVEPDITREHGCAQESMDHCFPRHRHGP
eukprot:7455274-Pyramimonas_sp.AAC.1